MCEQNGIHPLVERSRSGRGAHVWIIFQQAIPASKARNFGFMLLDKGASSVNLKSFHYYDRMYPSQDMANSIGNLVALPLQGLALKNGLENPQVIKTPVVRNGKQSTLGYQPDVWKKWN